MAPVADNNVEETISVEIGKGWRGADLTWKRSGPARAHRSIRLEHYYLAASVRAVGRCGGGDHDILLARPVQIADRRGAFPDKSSARNCLWETRSERRGESRCGDSRIGDQRACKQHE
jgi:hypothetical protein